MFIMSESFSNAESGKSVEGLQQELDKALIELGDAARAVGQYETGRPEADFGKADDLAETKAKVTALYEELIAAIIARGEAVGVASQTEGFDFKV